MTLLQGLKTANECKLQEDDQSDENVAEDMFDMYQRHEQRDTQESVDKQIKQRLVFPGKPYRF